MASADTIATVSKAFFRDVSICKTFGKFPSLGVAAPFQQGARDESLGYATNRILRPDFDCREQRYNK
jgi:hypothetical protein